VTTVGGVEELAQAVVARRDVGRHERGAPTAPASLDPELSLVARVDRLDFDDVNPGERRSLLDDLVGEGGKRFGRPLGLDHDAAAVVEDESPQLMPGRKSVHERPEPDALDYL
jgi:hypothetical protein